MNCGWRTRVVMLLAPSRLRSDRNALATGLHHSMRSAASSLTMPSVIAAPMRNPERAVSRDSLWRCRRNMR